MDYRDIVFITVAEKLSFSKAAEELFISQPAVTKHIKELENKYDCNLFDRRGNKISLSVEGKLLYNHLKQIQQKYNELQFEIGRLNNKISGDFLIGASSTISQYILPQSIASFHKRYPNIRISMVSGNSFEIEQLLINNKINMALVENESSQLGLQYKSFLNDELIFVCGANSALAKSQKLSKNDLYELPFVFREKGSGTLEVIKDAFKKQNINFDQLKVAIYLGSTEAIKNFLLDFDGLAIISKHAVQKELYLKTLVEIKIAGLYMPRNLRIAFKSGHKSRSVELFENFLQSYNFKL